jgi:hypothetical protein
MAKRSGIDAVLNFWEQVWQSPQNYDAIDDLVVEDFVFISGATGSTPIDNGATVARTNILDEFPYFGAPHADPIVD